RLRRQPDAGRELDRVLRARDQAVAEVEAARARKDDAEARRPELHELDGRLALDELTVEEAAELRGDIESETSGAEQDLERAERVHAYVSSRVVEAAHTAGDAIESKPRAALAKAKAGTAEVAKQLADADRNVANAQALL